MHATVTQRPWTKYGLPLLWLAAMAGCVLVVPGLAVPLAFALPLFISPLPSELWFSLIAPAIPAAGLFLAGIDTLTCLCLLPCGYLCLLCQAVCRKYKLHFTHTVLLTTLMMMLAQGLWWGRLAALVDGGLYAGLATLAVDRLTSMPTSGNLLFEMVQKGLLPLPTRYQHTRAFQLGGLLVMDPSLRAALLISLRQQLTDSLRTGIPILLMHWSLFIGVLFPLRAARQTLRQGPNAFVVVMRGGKPQVSHAQAALPAFRTLRLTPSLMGYVVVLAVGALLLRLIGGELPLMMSDLLYAAFSMVYYLLGAATLMWLLHKRHPGHDVLHGLAAAALYFLFPLALFIMGLLDQMVGLRRTHPLQKEEEHKP